MTPADRAVYAVCGAAMLLAVIAGGFARGGGEPVATDLQPEPTPTEQSATGLPSEGAIEVAPLASDVAERILSECFRIPSEADPAFSPAQSSVQQVIAGSTEGAGVVVWVGSAPDAPAAFGSCVAVDRGGGDWTLVGHGHRPDHGEGTRSVVWHTNAASGGAAAALTGRTSADAAEILLVLDDGRRLRQTVEGGIVAVPWTPVVAPVRLVVVDGDGEILYDGPPASYS